MLNTAFAVVTVPFAFAPEFEICDALVLASKSTFNCFAAATRLYVPTVLTVNAEAAAPAELTLVVLPAL